MGIYKRCDHKGKDRDRCEHEWYASYLLRGYPRAKVSLSKWTGRTIRTKTEANAAFDDLKADVRAGRFTIAGHNVAQPATPDGPLTFGWLASMFDVHYMKGRRLKTADAYKYRIKPLLDAFGRTLVSDLTSTTIEAWYAERRTAALEQGRSQSWQNRPVALLRTILKWAVKRGYLTSCPEFKLDREDFTRWRRVDTAEEARLLAAADPFLQPLIILALDTGIRRGEMLALRVGDVDGDRGVLRLRGVTTKNAKTREVPILTTRAREVLQHLMADDQGATRPALAPLVRGSDGQAITNFQPAWERCRLRAHGFEPAYTGKSKNLSAAGQAQLAEIDLHWHDLRHEFACRLDDRGVALGKIQRLLGHASIATTERYLMRGLKDLQTVILDDGTLPAFTPAGQPVAKSGQPPSVRLDLEKTGTQG